MGGWTWRLVVGLNLDVDDCLDFGIDYLPHFDILGFSPCHFGGTWSQLSDSVTVHLGILNSGLSLAMSRCQVNYLFLIFMIVFFIFIILKLRFFIVNFHWYKLIVQSKESH